MTHLRNGFRFGVIGLVGFMGLGPQSMLADDIQSVRYFVQDGVVETTLTGNGTTVNTPFTLASVGKTMTSIALLQLVDQGKVSLDDLVANFVDADIIAGFDGLKGITLRHLLTMTSGLPDYYDATYQRDALRDPDNVQKAAVALSYAYDLDRVFEVGQGAYYSNTNYVLLGLVLEQITGQSYGEAMQSLIFEPIGMTDSFVFGTKALPETFPQGHQLGEHFRDYYAADGFGDGGVISTAPDVAAFYQAVFGEERLLSATTMQTFMTDPIGYGYGMGIEHENGIVGHSGGDLGFATDVRMDLETGSIAIILSADGYADTDWAMDQLTD